MIASFEVEIHGVVRTIALERIGAADAGRYKVTIDGVKARVIDVRPAGHGRLSILFPEEQAASYDVAIASSSLTEMHIHLPEGAITAVVNGRRSRRQGPAETGSGEQRISAPMPGRVVKVLVAAGDEVRPRQPLVIVEAMKMENELSAKRGGRVRDVQVKEGMSVEAGRLLVIVD